MALGRWVYLMGDDMLRRRYLISIAMAMLGPASASAQTVPSGVPLAPASNPPAAGVTSGGGGPSGANKNRPGLQESRDGRFELKKDQAPPNPPSGSPTLLPPSNPPTR